MPKTSNEMVSMASIGSPPSLSQYCRRHFRGLHGKTQRLFKLSLPMSMHSSRSAIQENLCLYGLPDGSWHLSKDDSKPPLRVLPPLPEPGLGINFARDGKKREDWLALIAMHSDSWLLSVAFYYGARFNHNDRERLLSLINNLSTVYEAFKQAQAVKDILSWKRSIDDDEHSQTLCGICEENYYGDEFLICCDICEKWYHGSCVSITPAKAESIKLYQCPSCSSKKSRPN